jgi:hypothetical protein
MMRSIDPIVSIEGVGVGVEQAKSTPLASAVRANMRILLILQIPARAENLMLVERVWSFA